MKTKKLQKAGIKILALIFFLILNECPFGQYKVLDYDFPLPSTDIGKCVIKRLDGGFAFSGFSYSYPPGFPQRGYDWFFMKTKEEGDVERTKLIGFSRDSANNDHCFSLTQLSSDSNFVLAGRMSHTDSKSKATFVKLNKFGNIIVSKRISDTLNNEYHQVITTPGDTFVLAGFTEDLLVGGAVPNKILVGKYYPNGSRQWIFRYAEQNSPNIEKAYSVCYQPTDRSYAVASSYGTQRIVILKLNTLGQILAQRTFGFPNLLNYITEARKIIPMADGGFVMIGFTQAFDDIAMDVWVLRVESDLDVVWSGIYGNKGVYDEGNSIIIDNDSLVFTGYTGRPNNDMMIVKIPLTGGAPSWSKMFDASSRDIGSEIIKSTVGGSETYNIAGYKNIPIGTSLDVLLVNSNTDGEIPGTECLKDFEFGYEEQIPVIATPNFTRKSKFDVEWSPTVRTPSVTLITFCEGGDFITGTENQNGAPRKFALKQNYPNPFNPSTVIEFSVPQNGNVSVTVFDITGKEVALLVNGFKSAGNHSIEFSANGLSSGVYFYKLKAEGFEQTKKMLLVK